MDVARASIAQPELVCGRGVCAAGDPREAEAGVRALAAGGNAVDAAVAAAFAAFVVEQVDCGLGGFAHVSAWLADGGPLAVDGYVRAPAAAAPDMFAVPAAGPSDYGHPLPDAARWGGRAVAVPGAVGGLCEAHARAGRLPLAAVLAPAIELAEAGVAFSWRDKLVVADLLGPIARVPGAADVLLPGGRPPRTPLQDGSGDRLDTRPLARTLERIAAEGPAGFYEGPVARALAAAVERAGGALTAADLAGYRPRVLAEAPARYRDLDYTACGDVVAYAALNLLAGFDLAALAREDPAALPHLMAEALGVAFTDGLAHYGDPTFVRAPLDGLASPAYAEARRAALAPAGPALPRPIAAGDPWPFSAGAGGPSAPEPAPTIREGTSQVVAADAEGNVAAVITAVGWHYGSLVHAPEVGFLNNGMGYFDPRPGRPASIAPGKTPMFGAPPLAGAQGGAARFAAAGSGGYRIEAAVLHTLVHHLDLGLDLAAAVDRPRVHCQGGPTYVDARHAPAVPAGLKARGHDVEVLAEDASTWHFGRVCAVARDEGTGAVRASAGPHWLTAVAGL